MLVDLSAYRPEHFERQVLRWLQMAQQAQPDAKVVLVGTKADLITKEQADARCRSIIERIGEAEAEEMQRLDMQLRRADAALQVMQQMVPEAGAGAGAVHKNSFAGVPSMVTKMIRLSRKSSQPRDQVGAAVEAAPERSHSRIEEEGGG